MTNAEINKAMLLRTNPDLKPPMFSLVLAKIATNSFPELYPTVIGKDILKHVHVDSKVKVLVASVVGKPSPEEVWLNIKSMQPIAKCFKGARLIGEVIPPVRRSHVHGLHPGMLITFKFADIIDVLMTAHITRK